MGKIITLLGAGASVSSGFPTMIDLGKCIANNEIFQTKIFEYSKEIFPENLSNILVESQARGLFGDNNDFSLNNPPKELLDYFLDIFTQKIMYGNEDENVPWFGTDVELLLKFLDNKTKSESVLNTPNPPNKLINLPDISIENLKNFAMKLHALGSLSNNYIQRITEKTNNKSTYLPFDYRSPYQGEKHQFLREIEEYFKCTENHTLDLWIKTLDHLEYWKNVQKTIGINNNFRFETWFFRHLNFSNEISEILGFENFHSSINLILEPVTCSLHVLKLVHQQIDIFQQDLKSQINKVSNAAKKFLNWYTDVKLVQKRTPIRLYTTNWDYLPELAAGYNEWSMDDGFSQIETWFDLRKCAYPIGLANYYTTANPDAFSNSSKNKHEIELIRLHGGLDWYTNGLWVCKTKPLDYLIFLGKLYSKSYEDLVAYLSGSFGDVKKWVEVEEKAIEQHKLLCSHTHYARDTAIGGAIIHPTDSKGYPIYQPMRNYAIMLETDLLDADCFWIIGHSLADAYFITIIEKALRHNSKLRVLIQDPYPSETAKALSDRFSRVMICRIGFGDKLLLRKYI